MGESGSTILVIAIPNSVHTCGWIKLARASGIRLFLLAIYDQPLLDDAGPWRPVHNGEEADLVRPGELGVVVLEPSAIDRGLAVDAEIGYSRVGFHDIRSRVVTPYEIIRAIAISKPRIVHSMETQLAGYQVLEAKRRMGKHFPFWLHSNWGSDIQHFKKFPIHRAVLNNLATQVDGYTAECHRDLLEMERLGFRGLLFEPIPNSSGMPAKIDEKLRTTTPPSKRRNIYVKGYQGWSGRALNALSAIKLIADDLKGFRIRISHAESGVRGFVETLRTESGLDISLDAWCDRETALARRMDSRFSVGISVSDGISTTLLESMALGAFPIQSESACADEWITDGKTGFIVSPHDTGALAECMLRAAKDNELVDNAAGVNMAAIAKRWTNGILQSRIADIYAECLYVSGK